MFSDLSGGRLHAHASCFKELHYQAGDTILKQGEMSNALYILRSGRLAVRVDRVDARETLNYLSPPDLFGELSLLTERPCSANVEVVIDADVVSIDRDSLMELSGSGNSILWSMLNVLADRLHATVSRRGIPEEAKVWLLQPGDRWEAPTSFPAALGESLSQQLGKGALVVDLSQETSSPQHERASAGGANVSLALPSDEGIIRSTLADRLPEWKQGYAHVVINPSAELTKVARASISQFIDGIGALLGPGDGPWPSLNDAWFTLASPSDGHIEGLSGTRQLLWDARQSEENHRAGAPVTKRFQRTVDSIARALLNTQVGLALGGGAAWGLAHIGILAEFEQAQLPIDVIAGCSMGALVGGLYCSGVPVPSLQQLAATLTGRRWKFLEPRLWRMHLLSERAVTDLLREFFADRQINHMEIPFWATSLDIKTGEELTHKTGLATTAVRASIALPGLLPPLIAERRLLVDAGIMDPVPINQAREMGCRFAIAINAMQPLQARPMRARYPMNVFDLMFRCMQVTGYEIGEARCERTADIVLTPKIGDASLLDFGRQAEIIQAGAATAQQRLPEILTAYERLRRGQ